jgi:hypothetical protein
MRRSYISITWTTDAHPADARLLIRTVEDVFDLLRPHFGKPGQFDPLPTARVFGAWQIPSAPNWTPYRNVDWYTARCLDDQGEHILASRFLRTVRLEPWQATNPHFDLLLTDLPLLDDQSEGEAPPGEDGEDARVMGFSRRGLVSLVSSHELAEIASETMRDLAMRHLIAHYFGQLFDAPVGEGERITRRAGRTYCSEVCALRFTSTPQQAMAYGRQQAMGGVVYCEACQRDLVARITGYHLGLN